MSIQDFLTGLMENFKSRFIVFNVKIELKEMSFMA